MEGSDDIVVISQIHIIIFLNKENYFISPTILTSE